MRRGVMIALLLPLAACAKPVAKQDAPAPVPQVRVASVGAIDRPAAITGVGTVALRREASLGFTSPGRIARLTVNEGDIVRPGQLLAALDTTTVTADLHRARAERERAAAEFRRSETLMAQGWITRPRLENAKASLQAAEASVSAAQFQTANATIVAPGRGTVLARLAEPGQVVAAGTPVLVVGEAASGYVLRVPLSDRDAARINRGAPASVTLAAMGGAVIQGQVIEVGGRSDRATGTFVVEIGLPADSRLRSGQIGEASITVGDAPTQEIRVPATAVFAPRAGDGFVFVVDAASRKVRLRKVAIGETSDDGISVRAGLARGETIAVSRVDRLTDGERIDPIGPAGAAK